MTEPARASTDITHAALAILFLALLVAATFWVISPFLVPILWAIIVSVAVWPLFVRLETRLAGRRRLAVAIVTATLLMTIFIPVTLAVVTIVNNAPDIATEVRTFQLIAMPALPAWVEGLPIVGQRVAGAWTRFAALTPDQRSDELAPYAQAALQWFALKAGGIGTMLIQFLLTAIISAIVLANGVAVRDGILRFAFRLAGQHGHDVAILAAQTIRAVVLGVVVTAVVQAAVGGTGLLMAGVPAAGLLAALMLILCLAQLGPMPVLIPAVAWLFWSGQPGRGWTLLVITIIAGLLDNIVRPVLIKRGANLPLVLIFTGVIGGLIAFGIIGLFIGPVVLTVAYRLLGAWVAADPVDRPAESAAGMD